LNKVDLAPQVWDQEALEAQVASQEEEPDKEEEALSYSAEAEAPA